MEQNKPTTSSVNNSNTNNNPANNNNSARKPVPAELFLNQLLGARSASTDTPHYTATVELGGPIDNNTSTSTDGKAAPTAESAPPAPST